MLQLVPLLLDQISGGREYENQSVRHFKVFSSPLPLGECFCGIQLPLGNLRGIGCYEFEGICIVEYHRA